jgi:hypothetical protein
MPIVPRNMRGKRKIILEPIIIFWIKLNSALRMAMKETAVREATEFAARNRR